MKKTNYGHYEPSFYFIMLETDENLNEVIENDFATFVHEYIHFMQDISLPYCIRNTLVTIERFVSIYLKNKEDGKIKCPVDTIDRNDEITRMQFEYTWGDDQYLKHMKEIKHHYKHKKYVEEHDFNVYRHFIKTGEYTEYQIGSRHLLEYIAYQIEKKLNPDIVLPEYPYYVIEKFIKCIYPEYPLEPALISSLCEYCLFNDNPINFMSTVLEHFKKTQFVPETIEDVSNFIANHWVEIRSNKINKFYPIDKVAKRFGQIVLASKMLFSAPQFLTVNKWILDCYDRIIEIRRNDLLFISNMLTLSPEKLRENVMDFYKRVGSPLILNKQYMLQNDLSENADSFIYLYALKNFYNYLNSEEIKCPMIDFCSQNSESSFSDECYSYKLINCELENHKECFFKKIRSIFDFQKIE